MHIVPATAYDKLLLTEINSASKQIYLSAMVILAGPRTDPLFAALLLAIQRGVKVTLIYDTYGFRWVSRVDQSVRAFEQAVIRTKSYFAQLQQAGAVVIQTSSTSINPFKGINHVKLHIFDDTVHSFGGINLVDAAFTFTDYMLVTKDAELAQRSSKLLLRLAEQNSFPDERWSTAPQSILIDGGNAKQSIIYDRVCTLTAQARQVWYVSATQPTGKLARLLTPAKTISYFNRPAQLPVANRVAYYLDKVRGQAGVTNAYQGQRYIHAKCMLFRMPNGKQVLISGSHNFDWRGVLYGTKEIAIETSDTAMWQALYSFVQQAIS